MAKRLFPCPTAFTNSLRAQEAQRRMRGLLSALLCERSLQGATHYYRSAKPRKSLAQRRTPCPCLKRAPVSFVCRIAQLQPGLGIPWKREFQYLSRNEGRSLAS